MKKITNLTDYIGKYVRFEMYGTQFGQITGLTADKELLLLECPMKKTVFDFNQSKYEMDKVSAIQKVSDSWHTDLINELTVITEQEYKDLLFELMQNL